MQSENHFSVNTWTSADDYPATYEIYGGDWGGVYPGTNLKTEARMWHSDTSGPRGITVTFVKEVTITRFLGPHLTSY